MLDFGIRNLMFSLNKSTNCIYFYSVYSVSGLQAAAISYLGEFYSNSRRAKFVTFAAAFLPTATAFQPLLALGTLPMTWRFSIGSLVYAPWRLHILLGSCIMIFPFVSLLFLPESPKFLIAMAKKDKALEGLCWLYHKNTGRPIEVWNKSIYLLGWDQ